MNDPSSTGVGLGLFVWITLIPLLIVMFGRSRRRDDESPPPNGSESTDETPKPTPPRDASSE